MSQYTEFVKMLGESGKDFTDEPLILADERMVEVRSEENEDTMLFIFNQHGLLTEVV